MFSAKKDRPVSGKRNLNRNRSRTFFGPRLFFLCFQFSPPEVPDSAKWPRLAAAAAAAASGDHSLTVANFFPSLAETGKAFFGRVETQRHGRCCRRRCHRHCCCRCRIIVDIVAPFK